jgi:hypothetical protein
VTTEEQHHWRIKRIGHNSARIWGMPRYARRHSYILAISLLGALLLFVLDSTFGVSEYIHPRYQSAFPNHWTYISGTNRAQGCVAVLQPNDPTQAAPSSITTQIILLDRFGILLAASEAAAQKWPDLATASTYEHALIETILRHPAFVS